MRTLYMILLIFLLLGCNQKSKEKSLTGGMKCGAGKCGASMIKDSTSLGKKQMSILKQLKKDDKRIDCVKSAKSIKKVYDCVRDRESGRLKI